MRLIEIKEPKNEKADYSYVELNSTHYDEVLNENVKVIGPDGKIVFVFLKHALSKRAVLQAWEGVKDWEPRTDQRGLAKGKKIQYLYVNGVKTNNRRNRDYVCSGVIGFYDRFPTLPACRPSSYNANQPDSYKMLLPITREIARLHEQHDPESWAVYQEFSKQVHDDWKIGGEPYNTITMNKNFQTYPHKDGYNLKATCPMTVIRKGSYRGGNLVFPDYRLAVNIDSTDLILFMNSAEWHGNTRITGLTKDHTRVSMIWYCRKGMVECMSAEEEVKRVKNLKMGPMGK
jgi:hypothetical protein